MVTNIKHYFSPPIFPEDKEKTRIARLAFAILISTLGVSILYIVLFFLLVPELLYRVFLIIPYILLSLCLLPILRHGLIRFASIAMLIGFWATLTVAAASAGGVVSPPFHLYFVVVFGAGMLFGWRAAVLSIGLVVLTGVAMYFVELVNLLPPLETRGLTIRAWIAFDSAVLLVAVLLSLALNNINQALADAGHQLDERTRTQGALAVSEERFRSLSSAAFEGIMIHDRGIILDANAAFAQLFGFPHAEDLIGKNGLEILPFTPESREKIQKIIPLNSSERYEIQVARPDGTTFLAETQGREIIYRGRSARVVAIRDITERERAEEALRESEANYRALVENINDAIFALDEKGVFTFVSPVLRHIAGYEPAEIIGRPFRDFIYPGDLPLVLSAFQNLIQGQVRPSEYRIVAKSGKPVWVRSSSRTNLVGGRAVGIRGVLTDITARKDAEKQLKDRLAELEAVNKISTGLRVMQSLNEMLPLLLDETLALLDTDAGVIGLWDTPK